MAVFILKEFMMAKNLSLKLQAPSNPKKGTQSGANLDVSIIMQELA